MNNVQKQGNEYANNFTSKIGKNHQKKIKFHTQKDENRT